jgi:hypothetical protein
MVPKYQPNIQINQIITKAKKALGLKIAGPGVSEIPSPMLNIKKPLQKVLASP